MDFWFFKQSRLVKKARESKNWSVHQADLKKELDLQDREDVVVVEKSNMIKFLVRSCAVLLSTMAQIALIGLAVIGFAALVYPEPRRELLEIWERLVIQVAGYF